MKWKSIGWHNEDVLSFMFTSVICYISKKSPLLCRCTSKSFHFFSINLSNNCCLLVLPISQAPLRSDFDSRAVYKNSWKEKHVSENWSNCKPQFRCGLLWMRKECCIPQSISKEKLCWQLTVTCRRKNTLIFFSNACEILRQRAASGHLPFFAYFHFLTTIGFHMIWMDKTCKNVVKSSALSFQLCFFYR